MHGVHRIIFLFIFLISMGACVGSKKNPTSSRTPSTDSLHAVSTGDPDDFFIQRVKPILDGRCVACHACTEAPCGLHFTSYEGLLRGLNPKADPLPLPFLKTDPNRLKDAALEFEKTRDKKITPQIQNYFPIIQLGSTDKNQNSILNLAIQQGRKHNLATTLSKSKINPPNTKMCPTSPVDLKTSLYQLHPQSGMPYALPPLSENEYAVLDEWFQRQTPGPTEKTKLIWNQTSNQNLISRFEEFLNTSDTQHQLIARYIFEHAFSAHFHFDQTPDDEFYMLIRSPVAPHQGPALEFSHPAQLPMDPPFTGYNPNTSERFYYRFQKFTETIVRKTHIPWELNENILDRWQEYFLNSKNAKELHWTKPPENPLDYSNSKYTKIYEAIPVRARYQFLIDNAEVLIKTIVRTPVCSGKAATYAVKDHFWVFFLDQETNDAITNPLNFAQKSKNSETLLHQINQAWSKSNLTVQKSSLDALRSKAFETLIGKGLTEKNITNEIALTLFRHNTSISLHKGLMGGLPPRVWVLSYENFEEIYYNLVAEFEPWGTLPHQYFTWQKMVSERIQGENLFREFFVTNKRCENCSQIVKERGERTWFPNYYEVVFGKNNFKSKKAFSDFNQKQKTTPSFASPPLQTKDDEKFNSHNIAELLLYRMIHKVNPESSTEVDELNNLKSPNSFDLISLDPISRWEQKMLMISHDNKSVLFPQFISNLIFIKINSNNQNYVYTMQIDKAYESNKWVTLQDYMYDKKENQMVFSKGLLGDRPELFIELNFNELDAFYDDLKNIKTESQWKTFMNKYATLRNNPEFWKLYDFFNQWDKSNNPIQSGVFDLNQYEMEF